LKGCSETVFETSVFYFVLVLLMANGSDLNQTDRFRRIELPNFSDQVEEIPEPAYSGFVKLRNTVGKNHFLRRRDVVGFIYRVNKFLLKTNELYGTSSFSEYFLCTNFVKLYIFEGRFPFDN
jgi:hypothetical protein